MQRRTEDGVVTSARKTPHTLRVEVQYLAKHKRYNKYVRRRTVLHAHDAKDEANVGDRVRVMECRPVSKTKTWRLMEVLDRAPQD